MRLLVLRIAVWIALAALPAHAQEIFGQIHIPDNCEIKCGNGDGDRLFPQGTISGSCVFRCREIDRAAPPSPGVRPSGNNRAFILLEPMVYVVGSTGVRIVVPAGFVTDYASIPQSLWGLYSPHDQYSRAAIVHDYLYWSQLCTRAQADNLLMIAMKESEVPEHTRQVVYEGVHLFGNASWVENRAQRKAKMPRVVPLDRLDFPPNWSWEMYRIYLMQKGVEDPSFSGNNYCHLGNTDTVPIGRVPRSEEEPPSLVTRALHGLDIERLVRGPKHYD